jgi:predicted TIM-barrel fold metal-dependent hydrolase
MAMGRRGFLGLLACFSVGAAAGARIGLPAALAPGKPRALTGRAAEMVNEAWTGIERNQAWDTHVHITGLGIGDTGCWVNPKLQSFFHPVRQFKFDVFRYAAGISDLANADAEYVERLLTLHRLANPLGKLVAMAFDYAMDEDGEEQPELSDFYTPNEYVLSLAEKHPEIVACASIHPYRKDAIERLDRAAAGGAVAVKWLPNSMRMDPASERCDAFYKRLVELKLPLICHGGEEMAVDSPDAQELGNPLRLRRALEAGVRVVVAHCSSLGRVEDLDANVPLKMDAFDAFMRLFTDDRFKDRLFADISAITQFHRADKPLKEILVSKHLHERLVNGSDYPLPAIDPLISTRLLVRRGFLEDADRAPLAEIFDHNPLIFDFVLKRRVATVDKELSHSFAPKVFETAWLFQRPTS